MKKSFKRTLLTLFVAATTCYSVWSITTTYVIPNVIGNNREEKKSGIKFKKTGDAGALSTENGNYNVALYSGDDKSDEGQAIVDNDYSALVSTDMLHDEKGNAIPDTSIKVILDHDEGVPSALPAIHNSDYLWLLGADKKTLFYYEKEAEVLTGSRTTADMETSSGYDVLSESFVKSIGDPNKVIVFVTCKDDKRLVTFWVQKGTTQNK